MSDLALLTLLLFGPALGSLGLLLFSAAAEGAMKVYAVAVAAVTFVASLGLLTRFDAAAGSMQLVGATTWIPTWGVDYRLGIDGISLPLIILTTFVFLLALLASWNITRHIRGYLLLVLVLETGVLGVFLALDFVLFYVFWEVMLLPMYFLIGLWGGERREYAAIKFFLYTFAGSVLILLALLILYFLGSPASGRTFDLLALTQAANENRLPYGWQQAAFWLMFVGFAIKLPTVPLHTWLPDAHVEAPTPISMILAGVLLKTGGYGLIRIALPLCPLAMQSAAWVLTGLGVVSILYGALAALAQTDLKRLVAYSSVSHMGYVLLGLGAWQAVGGATTNLEGWKLGLSGAMFQMIGHGITSTGLFFVVGVLYDRVKHREIDRFGGISRRMPLFSALAIVLWFGSLGLPALCGFIGEFATLLAAFSFSTAMAAIACFGVVLAAGYVLWAVQRVHLGPNYRGPNSDALQPLGGRERIILGSLAVLTIVLGVFPALVLNVSDPSLSAVADAAASAVADAATTVGEVDYVAEPPVSGPR